MPFLHRVGALILIATFAWFAQPLATAATTFSSYSVGNSLTWDAGPPRVAALAGQSGISHTVGYHICCGQSLTYIYDHPTETCVGPTSAGTFQPAFTGHSWDAITLQPYPGATAQAERTALVNMIRDARLNAANQQTQFYIYASYPPQDDAAGGGLTIDFQAKWHSNFTPGPSANTILSRPFFDWLIDEVRQDTSDLSQPVLMIPLGDVIAEVDLRAQNDLIPGLEEAHELYRDRHHLNNVGRYVAATTFFATLFKTDPRGMSVPAGYFNADTTTWPTDQTITPTLAAALQSAVWDVVSSHPYSGVPEPAATALLAGALWIAFSRHRRLPSG